MVTNDNAFNMAVFCDLENVAIGVRDARYAKFDINKVLERLLLKGNIVVKKAYCDWDRYKEFKAGLHEAAFELIEIPHIRQSGKNSADIRMVVDALDLCYTKSHVSAFVVISGDSDFSPLVSKLRENNKTVIGVGVKKSSSDLLIANCDEFIFYDDLVRESAPRRPRTPRAPAKSVAAVKPAEARNGEKSGEKVGEKSAEKAIEKTEAKIEADLKPEEGKLEEGKLEEVKGDEAKAEEAKGEAEAKPEEVKPEDDEKKESKKLEALKLVCDTAEAIFNERGENEKVWGSMVKQTLRRRKPGFNESYYGFRSFSQLLEEAQARKFLILEKDKTSGSYIILDFGTEWEKH